MPDTPLPISDLPAASTAADANLAVIVQSGTTKKSTLSIIKDYIQAAFDSIYVPFTRTLNIGGSSQSLAANRTWTASDIIDSIGSTQGDILYRNSSAWVALAPGTDGFQLTTHGAAANPTWASSGGITPAALTKTDDTNVTLTLGGSPTTALVNSSSLTLGWTGTLAAARGGTGVGSLGNITKTDDTNVTLTLGGTPTGAVVTSTSFTLGWTGTLSQARGGFGKDTSAITDGQIPIGKTSDHSWNAATLTQGSGITITNGAGTITIAATAQAQTHAITLAADGSGSVLTAGTKNAIKIPYGGTLTGWLLNGSPSGSVTVDIFRSADGAGLPVTSIIGGGGTKPALSGATENSSTSFTSWTSTTLTAKDNIAISLSGITTTTYVSLTLYFS